MDSPQDRGFRAVINFVDDLWRSFGTTTTVTPLALYRQIIHYLKFTDTETINKILVGFATFLSPYDEGILSGDIEFAPDASIHYSERARLDLGRMYRAADGDTKKVIRNHLLNITTILLPTEAKKAKLAELLRPAEERASATLTSSSIIEAFPALNVDDATPEGAFLKNLMTRVQTVAQTSGTATDNPADMMSAIMSSGILNDVGEVMQNAGKGGLDPSRLMSMAKGMIEGVVGGGALSMFSGLTDMFGGGGKPGKSAAELLAEDRSAAAAAEKAAAELLAEEDSSKKTGESHGGGKKKGKKSSRK